MNADNHQIDVFGIGTNLVTCQAQPALGMVYKVVELKGTSRMKFSEEIGKITMPGPKKVCRVYLNDSDKPSFDLICLRDEFIVAGEPLKIFHKKSLESSNEEVIPT